MRAISKTFLYFCKLFQTIKIFQTIKAFHMILMFSNFSYILTHLNFVYLCLPLFTFACICLPLFTFVQLTHLCTNFVLVKYKFYKKICKMAILTIFKMKMTFSIISLYKPHFTSRSLAMCVTCVLVTAIMSYCQP